VCGRVVSSSSVTQLVDWLKVDVVTSELAPSWNVAPGRELYVVADVRGAGTRSSTRRMGSMRWGLVPSWSADPSSGPRPINARAESLLERPAFADAIAHRRCLVPVDGFYEWKRLPSGDRQPYFIDPAHDGPLVLAGLWDRWVSPEGEPLVTVAIVTVPANDEVAPLHDRMPAVLADPGDWDRWLDPTTVDPLQVTPLLRPADPGSLTLRPVDRRVNNVAHDTPDLLLEAEEPATLF
jgi:putative SOS response-associated peptidase YedK